MKELTLYNPSPRVIYAAGFALPPGASVKVPPGHVAAYFGNEKKIADAEASGLMLLNGDPAKDPRTRAAHAELIKEAKDEGLMVIPSAYVSRALTSNPPDGSTPSAPASPKGST